MINFMRVKWRQVAIANRSSKRSTEEKKKASIEKETGILMQKKALAQWNLTWSTFRCAIFIAAAAAAAWWSCHYSVLLLPLWLLGSVARARMCVCANANNQQWKNWNTASQKRLTLSHRHHAFECFPIIISSYNFSTLSNNNIMIFPVFGKATFFFRCFFSFLSFSPLPLHAIQCVFLFYKFLHKWQKSVFLL